MSNFGYTFEDGIRVCFNWKTKTGVELAKRIADAIAVSCDDLVADEEYDEAAEMFRLFCEIHQELCKLKKEAIDEAENNNPDAENP